MFTLKNKVRRLKGEELKRAQKLLQREGHHFIATSFEITTIKSLSEKSPYIELGVESDEVTGVIRHKESARDVLFDLDGYDGIATPRHPHVLAAWKENVVYLALPRRSLIKRLLAFVCRRPPHITTLPPQTFSEIYKPRK